MSCYVDLCFGPVYALIVPLSLTNVLSASLLRGKHMGVGRVSFYPYPLDHVVSGAWI